MAEAQKPKAKRHRSKKKKKTLPVEEDVGSNLSIESSESIPTVTGGQSSEGPSAAAPPKTGQWTSNYAPSIDYSTKTDVRSRSKERRPGIDQPVGSLSKSMVIGKISEAVFSKKGEASSFIPSDFAPSDVTPSDFFSDPSSVMGQKTMYNQRDNVLMGIPNPVVIGQYKSYSTGEEIFSDIDMEEKTTDLSRNFVSGSICTASEDLDLPSPLPSYPREMTLGYTPDFTPLRSSSDARFDIAQEASQYNELTGIPDLTDDINIHAKWSTQVFSEEVDQSRHMQSGYMLSAMDEMLSLEKPVEGDVYSQSPTGVSSFMDLNEQQQYEEVQESSAEEYFQPETLSEQSQKLADTKRIVADIVAQFFADSGDRASESRLKSSEHVEFVASQKETHLEKSELSLDKLADETVSSVRELSPFQAIATTPHVDAIVTSVRELSPFQAIATTPHVDATVTSVRELSPLQEIATMPHADLTFSSVSERSPLQAIAPTPHAGATVSPVREHSPLQEIATTPHADAAVSPIKKVASMVKYVLAAVGHKDPQNAEPSQQEQNLKNVPSMSDLQPKKMETLHFTRKDVSDRDSFTSAVEETPVQPETTLPVEQFISASNVANSDNDINVVCFGATKFPVNSLEAEVTSIENLQEVAMLMLPKSDAEPDDAVFGQVLVFPEQEGVTTPVLQGSSSDETTSKPVSEVALVKVKESSEYVETEMSKRLTKLSPWVDQVKTETVTFLSEITPASILPSEIAPASFLASEIAPASILPFEITPAPISRNQRIDAIKKLDSADLIELEVEADAGKAKDVPTSNSAPLEKLILFPPQLDVKKAKSPPVPTPKEREISVSAPVSQETREASIIHMPVNPPPVPKEREMSVPSLFAKNKDIPVFVTKMTGKEIYVPVPRERDREKEISIPPIPVPREKEVISFCSLGHSKESSSEDACLPPLAKEREMPGSTHMLKDMETSKSSPIPKGREAGSKMSLIPKEPFPTPVPKERERRETKKEKEIIAPTPVPREKEVSIPIPTPTPAPREKEVATPSSLSGKRSVEVPPSAPLPSPPLLDEESINKWAKIPIPFQRQVGITNEFSDDYITTASFDAEVKERERPQIPIFEDINSLLLRNITGRDVPVYRFSCTNGTRTDAHRATTAGRNISAISPESTSSTSKVVHKKIKSQSNVWDGNLKPYTESQLKALYYNRELDNNETFIEQFVEDYRSPLQHELYELLMAYFRARNNLQVSSKDIQALHQEYLQSKDYLWITTDHTITNKGQCFDGKVVTGSYLYQRSKFSDTLSHKVNRLLKAIRDQIYEHLSLYAYTSQMARLQVESYLKKVLLSSPDLKDIPHNSPVQGYYCYQLAPSIAYQVQNLKQCISILFSFQRKPIKDKPFVHDTRAWLTHLVAVLLRIATFDDHLFILNHVLRCPSGMSDWAAQYIQPPPPPPCLDPDSFGDANLDHVVTTLATMLQPVKGREDFLKHVKSAVMTASYLEDDDSMWVLVDSEGEEDEDPSHFWFQWRENDLVALLNQIPMESVFRYMFRIDRRDDTDLYNPSEMSEQLMMKIFSFATQLVIIFKNGLKTFNLVRYRQLAKRISRFVRHIVQYVSDHWQAYQTVRDTSESAMFTRLQIEFDQFFLRATYCIFSSQRLGSWQFMAGLPYACVSTAMLWQIIRLLHGDYQEEKNLDQLAPADWQRELLDPAVKTVFEENLSSLPECEAYYLLTSFANMACSRDDTGKELVEHIAMEIYDIAFVSNHTRETCSKGGRELLTLVATKHSFILSRMVHRVKETMTQVGMVSLYLFRELPFNLWQPAAADLAVVSDWLLCSQLTSPPNLLARLVLGTMNWGLNDNGELYLNPRLHHKVALMVAESYIKLIPAKQGLIAESFKQVTNIASMVCQTPTPNQAFCQWAWDLLLQLRLHLYSMPPHTILEALVNPGEALKNVPSMQREYLHSLYNGIREKQPIAAYVALVMTTYGHSIPEFERNLHVVNIMMENHQYRSVIHVLSVVTPLYYTNGVSLTNCKPLGPIIQSLLMCDLTYIKMAKNLVLPEFPGKYLKLFVAMVLHSATIAPELQCTSSDVFLMWLDVICNMNQWSRDRNALYVVDSICRAAFIMPEVMDSIKRFLSNHYKTMVAATRYQSPVSSFLWWMTTTTPSSLVNRQSCPEFPWFTFCALDVEAEVEEETLLWKTVALEMLTNQRSTPDMALKRAASVLHFPVPPLNQLAIYHWAHQAVDSPSDHPLTHLFWQRFFGLYLQRWSVVGQIDRGSIGAKFFDSMSNLPLLKRMKKRLHELVDFHQKQAKEMYKLYGSDKEPSSEVAEPSSSEGNACPKSEFHNKMAKLYSTLVLWIEEPKLHDSTLFLPSLPPQYDCSRLLQLQQNDKTPWLEYIDFEILQITHQKSIQDWINILNPKPRQVTSLPTEEKDESTKDRILKRLRSYETALPPPVIVSHKLPISEMTDVIYDNEITLLSALKEQFKFMTDYAKVFSQQMNQHIILDANYIELIPELYKNTESEATISVPCKQGATGLLRSTETKCSGAARITMRFRSKKMIEAVNTRIDQNRREYEELLNEMLSPPPQSVCSAAMFIETALVNLVKRYHDRNLTGELTKHEQMGVAVFYYIHQLIVAETNQYPPTRQFLTMSIEILGQEFINNNADQCQSLLRVILSNPESVGLLAPHFNPAAASKENFVHLYKALVAVTRLHNADLAFVLLTKFDVNLWLSCRRPKLSERQQILQLIGEVILVLGVKPEASLLPISEIYRSHLQALLLYQFPDHYGDVLQLLFRGSENQSISVEVWYVLFNSLTVTDNETRPFPVATLTELRDTCVRFAQNQIMFIPQQMKETLELLNSHFLQRRQSNKHAAMYGLYQKYHSYIGAIQSFLALMSHGYIYSAKQCCSKEVAFEEVVLKEVWPTICKAFSPWLQPFQIGARLSMPWVSGDIETALGMATAFGDTILFLHEHTNYSPNLLAFLLEFYTSTCRLQGSTSFILSSCYNQIFSSFEWWKFHVTTAPMKYFMEILSSNNDDCLQFLAEIFLQLEWPKIVNTWISEEPMSVPELMANLSMFIDKISFEPRVQRENARFGEIVKSTEHFPWELINASHYKSLAKTFETRCDPACVFGPIEDKNDTVVLKFLQLLGGYVNWPSQLHPETRHKRCIYVQMYGHLLKNWSMNNKGNLKANKDNITKSVVNLLEETEQVILTNTLSSSLLDESVPVLTQFLTMLNTLPSSLLQEVILYAVLSWAAAHPRSPLLPPCLYASCRSLASVNHMCLLTEAVISSHFKAELADFKASDGGWCTISAAVQIPELTEADFMMECVKHNNILTLYATILQRQSQCQTSEAQLAMLTRIVNWVIKCRPNDEAEGKMLLLWNKVIELSVNQGLTDGDMKIVCSSLIAMCQTLLSLAEDKTSSGFFGRIGLGSRSPYSIRFRLAARATAAFILSHISPNHSLRLKSTDTGSNLAVNSDQLRPSSQNKEPSAMQMCSAAIAQLEACKGNNLYADYQDQVVFLSGFLSNQLQCLQDYQHLMSYLSSSLFPEKNYLLVLKRTEQVGLQLCTLFMGLPE